MTAYDPPLSDGLARGNRYPEDDFEELGIDAWRQPAIYALRLSRPLSQGTMLDDWFEHYEVSPPPELYEARQASEAYYVGASNDVLGRVHEHLDSPNRSGAIMKVMPIHSVAEVWPQDDAALAFERESGKALEFQREEPDRFVWQN